MFKFNKVKLFSFDESSALDKLTGVLSDLGVAIVDRVENSDLLMVLGGDGTILHQAKLAHQHQVPIVGINLGARGFLADVREAEYDVVRAILLGQYIEDRRQVLRCKIGNEIYFSINEVMVSKSKPTRMIKYDVVVDNQFLYEQTADGMIVCTTTGSSAYALSAGGAILHPSAKILGLIPVCPSNITSRPVIICDNSIIEVTVHPWKDSEFTMAMDAQVVNNHTNKLTISLDKNYVTFLHPIHYDYYQTLQSKLNWESKPVGAT